VIFVIIFAIIAIKYAIKLSYIAKFEQI